MWIIGTSFVRSWNSSKRTSILLCMSAGVRLPDCITTTVLTSIRSSKSSPAYFATARGCPRIPCCAASTRRFARRTLATPTLTKAISNRIRRCCCCPIRPKRAFTSPLPSTAARSTSPGIPSTIPTRCGSNICVTAPLTLPRRRRSIISRKIILRCLPSIPGRRMRTFYIPIG